MFTGETRSLQAPSTSTAVQDLSQPYRMGPLATLNKTSVLDRYTYLYSWCVIFWHDSAVSDHNGLLRLSLGAGRNGLHGVKNFHSRDDLPKDDMFPIERLHLPERDEELTAIGVFSRVAHREEASLVVFQLQASLFVFELSAPDALAPRAVLGGEVPALHDAPRDDAVERHVFVVQGLPTALRFPLITEAQRQEIITRIGRGVLIELKDDSLVLSGL